MNYEDTVKKIIDDLENFDGFYSKDYLLDFGSKTSRMKELIEESRKEGRLLKIGIVGEMKAGKSSFLNSLIFDGDDILPKASTPMTAALTKISYSMENTAKIVFYSKKDWERVESYAHEYEERLDNEYAAYVKQMNEQSMMSATSIPIQSKDDYKLLCEENIPIQYRSCKELVELAKKSKINVEDWLGKEKNINCSHLGKELDDYIGAEGNYTAIVKHVELGMNNELLDGLEIVDTPGMNDPIVSRGETTKEFLQNCDVVFLLSYCGQFLTQEDITFMADTLPREGVKNVIIVGSKLDSGVLDHGKFQEFAKAVAYSKRTYDRQASENVKKSILNGYNKDILQKIQDSLPPLYISALMYDVARKNTKGIELEKYEKNIIRQFEHRFTDFSKEEKELLRFSGIGKVRSGKLKEVRLQKDQIITEKNRTIVEDNKHILLCILGQIKDQVNENYIKVKNGDIERLERQLHDMQQSLADMRSAVKNIFEKYLVDATGILNDMSSDIDLEIQNYLDFDIKNSERIEYHTVREGFLGLKKRVIAERVSTYSANVTDVMSNMCNYISRCMKYTNEVFSNIVNVNKLKKEITDIVLEAFRKSDKEFNENDILIPLDIVIGKIKIPEISINVADYQKEIIETFSGASVKDEDIELLKLKENSALENIAQGIKGELKKCETKIKNVMTEQSITFVDRIIENLDENIEMIRKQLENKEESMQQYEILKGKIKEHIVMIREMEI